MAEAKEIECHFGGKKGKEMPVMMTEKNFMRQAGNTQRPKILFSGIIKLLFCTGGGGNYNYQMVIVITSNRE